MRTLTASSHVSVLPQKLNRSDVCPRSRSKSTPDTHATPVTSRIFLHSAVNKTHDVSHIAHTNIKINLPMESAVMSLTSA